MVIKEVQEGLIFISLFDINTVHMCWEYTTTDIVHTFRSVSYIVSSESLARPADHVSVLFRVNIQNVDTVLEKNFRDVFTFTEELELLKISFK